MARATLTLSSKTSSLAERRALIWNVRTGRVEGGWTVEMEIPFKSLRYRPGSSQIWGIQLRRDIRRRNEIIYLSPVPIAAGRGAVFRVSDYATLVGVQIPEEGNTFELKPYGIAGLSTELFVVYTEDRDTDPLRPDRFSELRNRGLVVKVTRLFRF